MNEKKPTDELTQEQIDRFRLIAQGDPVARLKPTELRRAIAEALGYHVHADYFPITDRTGYCLIDRDGKPVGHGFNYWFEDQPWGECPDWPTDTGAAYLLCLEIAQDNNWEIISSTLRKSGRYSVDFSDGDIAVHWCEAATPALALSRLAHAALTESAT